MTTTDKTKKPAKKNKLQRHIQLLVWKCYMQRQRRWRSLLIKAFIALCFFLMAIFIAKPVFLTPLEAEATPALTSNDLFKSLVKGTIIGCAPDEDPYVGIMTRAAELLKTDGYLAARTLNDLNDMLYNKSQGKPIINRVIWIEWKPQIDNIYKFRIRCTETSRYAPTTVESYVSYKNRHLHTGFLAVQVAVSQAILEYATHVTLNYELSLVSMPVSPLMEEEKVRKAISLILLCYTLALLSPVLVTEALVVTETMDRFKRAVRIRDVGYASIYIGWLGYAFLTALPICLLGSIALILIFRWIHLMYALVTLMAYECVMMMLALIMAMFHNRALIACIWTTLFTLLQTFLAELIVHHRYDAMNAFLTFGIQMFIPPLGLVHGLNQFALLQTTRDKKDSLIYTLVLWLVMILFYFHLLMLLQRTIGQERAIGGQVSWKSIIFKRVEDVNRLRPIETPTGKERDNLQEVDEFVAKAISFRNVTKSIMGVRVLNNVTFDIYRGEFTILFTQRTQVKMMNTVEDLLTGLTHADSGTINLLGSDLTHGHAYLSAPLMMGYCDRSQSLIDDLTVEEHIVFYVNLSLWQESQHYIAEYIYIRSMRLKYECDLDVVWQERAENLDIYYRAQLCWAIAILLEPRVVFMPNFTDSVEYMAIIRDKIMQYKKYITIVKISSSSRHLEYADRVFLFDNKVLAFGGTPAYMFFKFGQEYRLRLTVTKGGIDEEAVRHIIEIAKEAGATVRAHLGSLLIFRLPTSPTDKVAALVKDLTVNAKKYGITTMNISVPDTEEVYNRARQETRAILMTERTEADKISARAVKRIAEGKQWSYKKSRCNILHLKAIGWKYFSFYIHYRFFLILTIICAIVAGVFLGLTVSMLLFNQEFLNSKLINKTTHEGEILTVEQLEKETTLVLRLDNAAESRSLANAYVLSQTKATKKQVERTAYTALSSSDSLTEYLITQAIDSPQFYVYMFAYGMDVATDENGHMTIQALYSPLHEDHSAAARSLARVYMALLRHYTGSLDATMEVTDDPLILDEMTMMWPTIPLLIQLLMILTISHITLVPSKEHGLIRHFQSHARNFTPARYWFTLYFCDLILYWLLVIVITAVMGGIILLAVPFYYIQYKDIMVVPFLLVVYGIGCIPQAYIFSLGPRASLNSMAFVIVNIVFGETTIITTLLYDDLTNIALNFLAFLSPQYNMALALVKLKLILFHNSECLVFKTKKLCASKSLHRCCAIVGLQTPFSAWMKDKCGVLQDCFERKRFLSSSPGILMEVIATICIAILFMIILLLWEYRVFQRCTNHVRYKWLYVSKREFRVETVGTHREEYDVQDKLAQLKSKQKEKVSTFGEYLLASHVTKKQRGQYVINNVSLGLAKGEALAISGLKRHGRIVLCETLAGIEMPSEGEMISMSKWRFNRYPHLYTQQISICCERSPLPEWMTVFDGLKLIGRLRGVPNKNVNEELIDYIEALDLLDELDVRICHLPPNAKKRLNFAAAVIGAPPVLILDECSAHQEPFVRRAMYHILYCLRKRGHAILTSSSNVESHMPVTNRLALLVDGHIHDIDLVDNLVERYSHTGYTVVVHLKDEVDVSLMFAAYFNNFIINDTSDVLVNVQVLDINLNWAEMFETMEKLKTNNNRVYSYIVCAIPIDYVYNSILHDDLGSRRPKHFAPNTILRKVILAKKKIRPRREVYDLLEPFQQKYDITTLKELPWSVIFQR